MTATIFPSVDEPITVGFIRNMKRISRGEQDSLEFLYNGGWLHLKVTQKDFYGKATHVRITGTDNRAYTVNAKRRLGSCLGAGVWHDLKKLADPDYDHPFNTGMGADDVEHPFHRPGNKPIRIA